MATELLDDDAVADIVELARANRVPLAPVSHAEARRPRQERGTARGDRVRRRRFPRPISPSSSGAGRGTRPSSWRSTVSPIQGTSGRSCATATVPVSTACCYRATGPCTSRRRWPRPPRARWSTCRSHSSVACRRRSRCCGTTASGRSASTTPPSAPCSTSATWPARPICVVLGAEGAGLSRLVRERCDVLVAIPMHGRISSLNVSAAAALATYEIARHRSG